MSNRAIVYQGPTKMAVEDIGYPKMEAKGRPVSHGVILRILATNICGSDLHMYHGRTDLAPGTPVGHEITGEIIEKGSDVEMLSIGDIVSVPFNVACGRCRNCKEQQTSLCLTTNDLKPGAAYGYAEMGPWQGGQAEFVFVPYADFNLLKFPDREQAMEKMYDLTLLSDVFPTGFYGAVGAGVGPGSTVYIAGAGPVGLAAAVSSYLLGAACVIIGDYNQDRLDHARRTIGCETINISGDILIQDAVKDILRTEHEVDCGIDAIGYEAHGHGPAWKKGSPTDALDTIIEVTRAGGALGISGVYLPTDPQGTTKEAKMGRPAFEWGRLWDKELRVSTGQTPSMKFNRQLMNAILFDRVKIGKALNMTAITLEEAPRAYQVFNEGVPFKFMIDPHNALRRDSENEARKNLAFGLVTA